MSYILNIGLAREGQENLKPFNVLRAIRNLGCHVVAEGLRPSDTEPTLVVHVVHCAESTAETLAVILEQDCVARYHLGNGKGQLIGPRADKWGDFNPEYFLLLDGSRLSAKTL